jgi:hypothetical protein
MDVVVDQLIEFDMSIQCNVPEEKGAVRKTSHKDD